MAVQESRETTAFQAQEERQARVVTRAHKDLVANLVVLVMMPVREKPERMALQDIREPMEGPELMVSGAVKVRKAQKETRAEVCQVCLAETAHLELRAPRARRGQKEIAASQDSPETRRIMLSDPRDCRVIKVKLDFKDWKVSTAHVVTLDRKAKKERLAASAAQVQKA